MQQLTTNPVLRDAERAHASEVENANWNTKSVGPCKGARSMYCEVECIDLVEDGRERPRSIYSAIVNLFGEGHFEFLKSIGAEVMDQYDFPPIAFGDEASVECAKRSLVFAFQEELYERVGGVLVEGGNAHYYTLDTLSKQPRAALTVLRRMKVQKAGREAYRSALRVAQQVYQESTRED